MGKNFKTNKNDITYKYVKNAQMKMKNKYEKCRMNVNCTCYLL